jgi:glycogen operon protein
MLLAGDEIGRTQGGNNNAYCQDNEISWLDWELDDSKEALRQFTRDLIALRKAHPVLHRRKFFQGREIHGSELGDIAWFTPEGNEMDTASWSDQWTKSLSMRLGGEALGEVDPDGELLTDVSFLLLVNAHHEPISFVVPPAPGERRWALVIDTNSSEVGIPGVERAGGEEYELNSRSLALFREVEIDD